MAKKTQTVARNVKATSKASKPSKKPFERNQAYRKFIGRFVGQEGNLSPTGVLPAPSEAAMAETDIAKMSNSRAMLVWNENVPAANKAGIEIVTGYNGGTIKVVAKRSLWLSTKHGRDNLAALQREMKAKRAKFTLPTKVPAPKLSKEAVTKAASLAKAAEKALGSK